MRARDLRLLVMHVSTRCDQACAHCSIWRSNGEGRESLGLEERLALIREARALGARAILFTGGEPLLCDHIESLARAASGLGLSVQIATNGLGLARAASWIGESVDEVYVSVEGPLAIHDSIRGAAMFSRLSASLGAVRALPRRPRLIGRSVVSNGNAASIEATVAAARALGLDGISFLAADSTSDAFGGDPVSRGFLRPDQLALAEMRGAIARLDAAGELGRFVSEDASSLARIAADANAGSGSRRAPLCNAPEWSSVLEADGALRPCFFQPKALRVGSAVSLGAARRSPAYANVLRALGPGDPVCAACVCPKYVAEGVGALKQRVKAALGIALPRRPQPRGVQA